MTLAPSWSPTIPFPPLVAVVALDPVDPVVPLAVEVATVDVTELVAFAGRLDVHALRAGDHEGERVSARGIVAKAFLVAALRHPGLDVRWPALPARHGMRLSELTAALENAEGASPIPDDAAVLSISDITRQPWTVGGGTMLESRDIVALRLAFDPRRTDAAAVHAMLDEFAGLLADPWELIAHC